MQAIRKAVSHFLDFHQGTVNIIVHIIGFVILFSSIYILDWKTFALSIIVLESGHLYNHFRGIRPYNFRIGVLLWRTFLFALLVALFYLISLLLNS